MKIIREDHESFQTRLQHLKARRFRTFERFNDEVERTLKDYQERREQHILDHTKNYYGVEMDADQLWLDPDLIKNSHKLVSASLRQVIEHTVSRVERFQAESKPNPFQTQEEAGLYWGREYRAFDRVGVYVPRSYFLTLVLSVVPARSVGVNEIVIATPPLKKLGAPYVDPTVLYLAKLFEIDKLLVAGGVSALCAMAFGTKGALPVEKIVGPTSKMGLVAKHKLSAFVGIDGLTGPAEVAFVCDDSASVKTLAADIIGLADRNPEAEVFVFHDSEKWLEGLLDEFVQYTQNLKDPESRDGVSSCLESRAHLFRLKKLDSAFGLVNDLSPGMTCLMMKDAAQHAHKIKSTGSLLLGHYSSPVPLDLIGGATGLVSTLGAAAFWPMTSPETFLRRFNIVELQKEALERLQKQSLELSEIEGFSTHRAVFESRTQ